MTDVRLTGDEPRDVGTPPDDVWAQTVALLAKRDQPKWASLSWITLRPLISAVNDRINAFAPALVDDLRREWTQRTRAAGGWPAVVRDGDTWHGVVDRTGDTRFILLGDTGEQDPSQYVLVPALREAARTCDFMLICSDVVYPSGDVNDYVHALYLPYGPRPDRADGTDGTDGDQGADGDPLATLDILALPGNHDWYDGLTGFMEQFCGRPALPPSAYGWREGITWTEALARLVWRRPSPARPARLWRPDGPAGTGGPPQEQRVPIEVMRHRRVPGGAPWHPHQPGSYYAVETEHLLLVCIDTGIGAKGESVLDAEQSAWLLHVSGHPKPKLLLTGNPLLVNGLWKSCRLHPSVLPEAGAAVAAEADVETDADAGARPVPVDVRGVVEAPEHRYVATVGGDVHNFQEYAVPLADGRTMRHVVSGGGGAYLSATHPVPVAAARRAARLQRHLTPYPGEGHSGPAPLRMYPDVVDSLQRFGRMLLLRVWRFLRILAAVVGGMAAGLALAWPGSPWSGAVSPGASLVVGALALGALVGVRVFMPAGLTRTPLYRRAVIGAAVVGGATGALAVAWLDPRRVGWNLLGWAALTAAGSLLAYLVRRSGWWREPRLAGEEPPGWVVPVAGLTWTVLVLTVARFDSWLTVGALVVLEAVAYAGWVAGRRRVLPRGLTWSGVAPVVAYAAQGLVGLTVVGEILLRPRTAWYPLAVVLGVVAAPVLAFALLVAVAFGLRGVLRLVRGAPGWRAAYGERGALGPWLVGTGMVALPVLGLWSASRGDRAEHPGLVGVLVATTAFVTITVVSVLLLDLVRRSLPGTGYKVVNVLLLAGWTVLLLAAFAGTWVPRATLTGLVVVALVVLTVVLVNLTFLGTYALVLDRDARRAADPGFLPFTPEGAAQVLRWRMSGSAADKPADPKVVRRAQIVFPSTDQPQGPVQKQVSEIFDSDVPPFAKHFLVVSTTSESLVLTPQPVDGVRTLPPLAPIEVPLR
jgi:hypothetical protein